MFKGILPSSKKSPSFDIVAPGDNGKENRPQHPLANVVNAKDGFRSPNLPTQKKFEAPPSPRQMKPVQKDAPGGMVGAGAMNRAFEQMLVRTSVAMSWGHLPLTQLRVRRMTCRYRPPSAQNSLRSIRQ